MAGTGGDDDEEVRGWLADVVARAGGDAARLVEPSGAVAESLVRLAGACGNDAIRDVELSDAFFADAASLLEALARRDTAAAMTPARQSAIAMAYGVVVATVSIPEWAEHAAAWAGSPRRVGELATAVVARLAPASEATARTAERAVDNMGGVTSATATPDAMQPATGSLRSLHDGAAPAPAPAVPVIPAAAAGAARLPKVARRPAVARKEVAVEETEALRALAAFMVLRFPATRPAVAAAVIRLVSDYCEGGYPRERAGGVRHAVLLADALIRGSRGVATPTPSHSAWLAALLPLHSTPGMLAEAAAVLSVFHEPLAVALLALIDAASAAPAARATRPLASVFTAINAAWADARAGNSPKAVLLIHEVDQLLAYAARAPDGSPLRDEVAPCVAAVAATVADAIASDNSRVAQLALGLFKSDAFTAALVAQPGAFTAAVAAVLRGGRLHWNATVNKLTVTVLAKLAEVAPSALAAALEATWGTAPAPASAAAPTAAERMTGGAAPLATADSRSDVLLLPSAARDADGYAVPPPRQPKVPRPAGLPELPPAAGAGSSSSSSSSSGGGGGGGGSRANPPVTITGVAPWAVRPPTLTKFEPGSKPPVTITGVAPWAVSGSAAVHLPPPRTAVHSASTASAAAPAIAVAVSAAPVASSGAAAAATASTPAAPTPAAPAPSTIPAPTAAAAAAATLAHLPGLSAGVAERVAAYVAALAPPVVQSGAALYGSDAPPPEAPTDLLAATPKLLPSLAFHDLAFGHTDLGSGTFSVVKYAKHIRRGTSAALWPEYAVKVVSTSTIAALGYESAVRREIAVLSLLTHPNIARLVSAFRWRDGAYLVMEYAPKGDLHTLLSRLGSLEEGGARFLVAELATAMRHVHAAGFAYGDCKPENVLLVEDAAGGMHVKLTDFGACRAITRAGADVVAAARDILAHLRDGDWRAAHGVATAPDGGAGAPLPPAAAGDAPAAGTDDDDDEDEEDNRVEGTVEYLSPELAQHTGTPTVASDAYALGVTLFQLLSGKLPEVDRLWPSDAGGAGAAAGGRHARFAAAGGGGGGGDAFPADFPRLARDLVLQLTHPDAAQRLGGGVAGFDDVLAHDWFAPLGGPDAIAQLHRATGPIIAQGMAPPPSDPGWSRRHNSTIWAPLPRAFGAPTGTAGGAAASTSSRPAASYTARDLLSLAALPPLA